MSLIFDIAWTHVTARLRQTLVGILVLQQVLDSQ